MTEDQKKILQLETEFEKLSARLNLYRKEIEDLKKRSNDDMLTQ